jgi:hypothetical protein
MQCKKVVKCGKLTRDDYDYKTKINTCGVPGVSAGNDDRAEDRATRRINYANMQGLANHIIGPSF